MLGKRSLFLAHLSLGLRGIAVLATVMASAPAILALTPAVQTSDSDQPRSYAGPQIHIDGVFVTPVPGAPFTATVLIESVRQLPDGTTDKVHTINQIARDARGRIRNERRRLESESFHGTPPLTEVHVYDPATRANTFYVPGSRLARQTILALPPANTSVIPSGVLRNNPFLKEEDLGSTTLDGMPARGLRRTRTIPAATSGTGKPVEVVDEYWYSDDLHMNLLVHHIDPRTGEQTVAVSDINRVEPPDTLLEIPEGFKVVDVTPPGR